jgi:hypothetical protein
MLINATREYLKEKITIALTEQAWIEVWLDIIAWSAGFDVHIQGAGSRFAEILRERGHSVVAVIEGLEELYNSVNDPNVSTAMRAALVGLILRLRAEPRRPLGLVIFARRDTIAASVSQNLDQFRLGYSKFALTWTEDDILEMAAWLTNEAGAITGIWTKQFADLPQAEKAVRLEPLWGRKLGRDDKPGRRTAEAYTATWIIAVLSDLRGRLVPRDLIRLLRHAATVSLEAGEGSDSGEGFLCHARCVPQLNPQASRRLKKRKKKSLN